MFTTLQLMTGGHECAIFLRMVRMEQLREQGEIEEERQSAEVANLEDQMDEEWIKCRQQLDAVRRRLEARATEVGVALGGA